MVVRGDVKAPIATPHDGGELVAVGEVAFDTLELGALKTACVSSGSQQCRHAMSTCVEFLNKIRTDESGGPGNEAFHASYGLLLINLLTAVIPGHID
jgi:hypothetical protein